MGQNFGSRKDVILKSVSADVGRQGAVAFVGNHDSIVLELLLQSSVTGVIEISPQIIANTDHSCASGLFDKLWATVPAKR